MRWCTGLWRGIPRLRPGCSTTFRGGALSTATRCAVLTGGTSSVPGLRTCTGRSVHSCRVWGRLSPHASRCGRILRALECGLCPWHTASLSRALPNRFFVAYHWFPDLKSVLHSPPLLRKNERLKRARSTGFRLVSAFAPNLLHTVACAAIRKGLH